MFLFVDFRAFFRKPTNIHYLHHFRSPHDSPTPSRRADDSKRKRGDSAGYYGQFLGLEEIEKPESLKTRGGIWLSLGAGQALHLGIQDGLDRTTLRSHIGWQVDDVAEWRRRMEARGVTILEGIAIPGLDRFEFRDPFGNRLEMLQEIA
ncbi:hypothetical protein AeRB84_020197 [Aphanomyces euteiches]|nr:hypothetical protein AeRB84_020197 [Aphanomyces euteiches]